MLPSGRISLLFIHSFVLIPGEDLWLVTVASHCEELHREKVSWLWSSKS